MRPSPFSVILCGLLGLCLALPGWSELPLYFPAKPGDRTIVRSPLVLEAVHDRREVNQRLLHGGEKIVVGIPHEYWKQPLATELGPRLARDFAVVASRSDTSAPDTLRVDVSVLSFVAMPSTFFSPAWADVALEFKMRSLGGESGSVNCQSHRTLPLGECFSNGSIICASIAGGLALRECIEDFYKKLPGTSWQKAEASPKIYDFLEYAELISASDTGVKDMHHRWGIGYGGTLLGADRDHPMNHGVRLEYSYERSLFKGSLRMAWNIGDTAGDESYSLLFGLGVQTDPDVLTGFVQGLGGWEAKRVFRSGAEKSMYSNRLMHRDSPDQDGGVGFKVIGIRTGLDFDWDRRGKVGGGLEISAMLARLYGRWTEDDPWMESPPGDISEVRFELEALLCLRL